MQTTSIKADWQQQLSDSVTNIGELLSLLQLEDMLEKYRDPFPLRVPRDFIARMQPGNPRDPLLLQVLPTAQELVNFSGYWHDPLNEQNANKLPGLLHKYHGRVLLIATGGCAVHCRYCFRRHFPYQKNLLGQPHLKAILDYLAADTRIYEVILSGGDPLTLKDEALRKLITALSDIAHVKYLRLHTRFPIVIPARITTHLTTTLSNTRLKTSIVLHCNHPNEINLSLAEALRQLHTHPIQLLNQSVLLRGVNDDAHILVKLSHQLYENGVMPYYLHLLDKVQGAAHFAVSEAEGLALMQQLREQLPGYLIPKFVKEVANTKHKMPIF